MNSMKKTLTAALFSVAIGLTGAAQTAHTVYIDPMSNNGPANWNNISFGTTNATAILKDSLTNSTGIRLSVVTPLQGANNNASTSPTGDAAEFAPAAGNSAYGNTNVWSGKVIPFGLFVFSNLNAKVAYTFTFYASRMSISSGDIRDARYTLTGSNTVSTTLNATLNDSQVATLSHVYPQVDGTLTLRIEQGPNSNTTNANGFFYITAMKFVYTDPPPVTLYVDAAGLTTAAGWNLFPMNQDSDVMLADTNGVPTGIRALMTTPCTGVNNLSTVTPVGEAAEFQPAGVDVAFTPNTSVAYARFYGLNPTIGYTFTFYAQRAGVTDTREALYTLSGANSASNTLDASSNTQNVAIISGILPASDGSVTLRISRGANNTGGWLYVTAFKITYVDNGLSIVLPDITGKRLLFLGNEYTSTESVPALVATLAERGGYTRPFVVSDLANGRTLTDHIARVSSSPGFNVDSPALTGSNTWDHVIIQGGGDESSSLGDVVGFRTNALALVQAVKNDASGKGVGVGAVLFQTWARGMGNAVYPGTFADPSAMQAEIRSNYMTASNNIAVSEGLGSVSLAPAGDAFERGGFSPDILYATDLSTPGKAGPELAAMMIYKTIYGGAVTGITYDAAINAGLTTMTEADWIRTTCWADGLTPPEPQPPAVQGREVFLIDTAPNSDAAVYQGWNYMSFHTADNSVQLALTNGYPTAATCTVTTRLNYSSSNSTTNLTGAAAEFVLSRANNSYGNVNPFGTYSNAICEAVFSGLNKLQSYTFTLFGSRTGVTGGISRETLYTLTGANSGNAALETANNTSEVAVVPGIRPAADGTITLRLEPGPNNNSPELFYHINALKIESVRSGMVMSLR